MRDAYLMLQVCLTRADYHQRVLQIYVISSPSFSIMSILACEHLNQFAHQSARAYFFFTASRSRRTSYELIRVKTPIVLAELDGSRRASTVLWLKISTLMNAVHS